MNNTLARMRTFHKTKLGYAVFALVELAGVCLLGLWALDNGSLWLWGSVAVLLFGAAHNATNVLKVSKK